MLSTSLLVNSERSLSPPSLPPPIAESAGVEPSIPELSQSHPSPRRQRLGTSHPRHQTLPVSSRSNQSVGKKVRVTKSCLYLSLSQPTPPQERIQPPLYPSILRRRFKKSHSQSRSPPPAQQRIPADTAPDQAQPASFLPAHNLICRH